MKNNMHKYVKIVANKSYHTFKIGEVVTFTEGFCREHPIYISSSTGVHCFLYTGDYVPLNNKNIK